MQMLSAFSELERCARPGRTNLRAYWRSVGLTDGRFPGRVARLS
jgi:hypothetical protein